MSLKYLNMTLTLQYAIEKYGYICRLYFNQKYKYYTDYGI